MRWRERIEGQRCDGAGLELAVDRGGELPGGDAVGADARLAAPTVFVIAEISDPAPEVARDPGDAERDRLLAHDILREPPARKGHKRESLRNAQNGKGRCDKSLCHTGRQASGEGGIRSAHCSQALFYSLLAPKSFQDRLFGESGQFWFFPVDPRCQDPPPGQVLDKSDRSLQFGYAPTTSPARPALHGPVPDGLKARHLLAERRRAEASAAGSKGTARRRSRQVARSRYRRARSRYCQGPRRNAQGASRHRNRFNWLGSRETARPVPRCASCEAPPATAR